MQESVSGNTRKLNEKSFLCIKMSQIPSHKYHLVPVEFFTSGGKNFNRQAMFLQFRVCDNSGGFFIRLTFLHIFVKQSHYKINC